MTAAHQTTFNLVTEPWIRVRWRGGTVGEVSLQEVFREAPRIRELAGDLATQDFAILRVLLAILQRAVGIDEDADPADMWGKFWRDDGLPAEAIGTYLTTWEHKFDLLSPSEPFMQVAGLRTARNEVSAVAKIIADVPDGERFFAMRSGTPLERLGFAEAARWVVHAQAYDVAGIKTGTVGDNTVKGGKSYGNGYPGWAGQLGGVYIQGPSLRETLLLNLCLAAGSWERPVSRSDLPCWERDATGPGSPDRSPDGPADLYTWQARRLRVVHDRTEVVGVVLTNGDKIKPQNRHTLEPLTGWRRSKAQEKALKLKQVYMPAEHHSDRAMWRGLDSLLPTGGESSVAGVPYLPPRIADWIGYLASDGGGNQVSPSMVLRIRGVGLVYGAQNSTVAEVVEDDLAVRAEILSDRGLSLVELAREMVKITDDAVVRLGYLAANLEGAAGGDTESAAGPQQRARARAYFEIDGPFRSWLARLSLDADPEAVKEEWKNTARRLFSRISNDLVSQASPQAFVGHPTRRGDWMTTAKAEALFRSQIRALFPQDKDTGPAHRHPNRSEAS
jgi:CRISPR system Cascade subunit CasA